MRSPFLASLFVLLSASFGFVAQAADSAADLAVQLGIIANNSTSQPQPSSKTSTMMLNGVVYAVNVIKDSNGNLSVTPVESATPGEIIVIEKDSTGKNIQVSKPASAFPASIAFSTAVTDGGGISVSTMTIKASANSLPTVVTAAANGTYTVTSGPALTLVAVEGGATTSISNNTNAPKTVVKTSSTTAGYTPAPIVIIYAGTNTVQPGDAKNNPSPN